MLKVLEAYKINSLLPIVMGVSLLAISAQMEIPLYPVPLTLQTMALLFIGCHYCLKDAFLIVASYLILAIMGAPITAGFVGGFGIMLKYSFGYLLGFLPSVMFLSYFGCNQTNFAKIFMLGIFSHVIIYFCGVTYLVILFGLEKALVVGLLPFIIGDVAKTFLISVFMKLSCGKQIERS